MPTPIVPCPQCGGNSLFAPSNPDRPFCSSRCKQIDLGAWASENFRVTGAPADSDELLNTLLDSSGKAPTTLH